MAERRMYAKTIVLSDAFLDMPMSARCLYFTLGMLADDDGFVNAPRSIMRQCGSSDDDMRILISKKFVIIFETGVIVIKHWRINNYLRNDRYVETKYVEEKARLTIDENGAYHLANPAGIPGGIPTGIPSSGIPSIGKASIGKDSIGQDKGECEGEENTKPKRERKAFVKPTVEEVAAYCKERNNGIDAEAFVAHYESNGWMVGKNPMKNWRMSVITWEKNNTVGGNYKGRESSKPDKFDYGTEADYDEYGFPIGK